MTRIIPKTTPLFFLSNPGGKDPADSAFPTPAAGN